MWERKTQDKSLNFVSKELYVGLPVRSDGRSIYIQTGYIKSLIESVVDKGIQKFYLVSRKDLTHTVSRGFLTNAVGAMSANHCQDRSSITTYELKVSPE